MGQKLSTKEKKIEEEEKYIAFLKKRLESANYKAVVSKEEYNKEKFRYNKAKFRLKIMKESK